MFLIIWSFAHYLMTDLGEYGRKISLYFLLTAAVAFCGVWIPLQIWSRSLSSGLEPNASKTARAGAAALALALLATVAGSGIGPWLAQWTGSSARLIIPGLVSALTALAAWLTCLSLLPAALAGERPGAGARIGLAAVGGGLAFGVTLWAQGSFTGAAALGLGGATGFLISLAGLLGVRPIYAYISTWLVMTAQTWVLGLYTQAPVKLIVIGGLLAAGAGFYQVRRQRN